MYPDGFFAVVEEEGTDNFANQNNAVGTIEAMRRADAAIGVAIDYVDKTDPNTLVVTAADSDAGGLQVFQYKPYNRPAGNVTPTTPELADSEPQAPFIGVNPTTTNTNRVVLDGVNGSTGSPEAPWRPFTSEDSIDGPMGNFGIAWAGTPDFPGSIVSKTYGMNADKLPSTLDNTEIYELMYETMFGVAPQLVAEQQETELVSGNTDGSPLIATLNGSFDGINDTVFTGAGNDEIDVLSTSLIAGRNRINSGSGDDIIFISSKDNRVFGGAGNDELDATDSMGGNRMSGGEGDDIFYLGMNDRALGGAGDDQFYVQSGGDNILSGGTGADQFWIVSAELPEAANTIIDFEIGTDVIGILGSASLGIDASTLELNVVDGNTEIGFAGQTLAMLNGVTGLDINTSVVFA
ncbi:MAG: hypothetical protein ACFCUV_09850 [Rivularia sp. (in: cyanobacteria)]